MTGLLDSTMRPLAENLIESFGGAATYTQTSESYDASTGKTTVTNTERSVVVSPPSPYMQHRVDGSTIQVGDMSVMLKARNLGFTPAIGDKLNVDGSQWQVVAVLPLFSGAQKAAYTLQLRQ